MGILKTNINLDLIFVVKRVPFYQYFEIYLYYFIFQVAFTRMLGRGEYRPRRPSSEGSRGTRIQTIRDILPVGIPHEVGCLQ